jgi:hypothetical protein
MHHDTIRTESPSLDHAPVAEAHEASATEWVTPDFTEQSACAEICAYVFTA